MSDFNSTFCVLDHQDGNGGCLIGCRAVVHDSEGNRIALHSTTDA